jgi:hypothetical protein
LRAGSRFDAAYRVDVHAEGRSTQLEHRVDQPECAADDRTFLRVREHEPVACPLRRRADERVDVGIAADDAVHDDDVVRLDRARFGDEVPDAPLDAIRHPTLGEQLAGDVLVLARELDVRRPVGARGEQFQLDCPDAAADLEHARAAHVAAQLEQVARGAAQAVAAKAACVTRRLPPSEERLVVARAAASSHARDCTTPVDRFPRARLPLRSGAR